MNDVENEAVQAALPEEESSDSDNDDAFDPGWAVPPNNVSTEAEKEDNAALSG